MLTPSRLSPRVAGVHQSGHRWLLDWIRVRNVHDHSWFAWVGQWRGGLAGRNVGSQCGAGRVGNRRLFSMTRSLANRDATSMPPTR